MNIDDKRFYEQFKPTFKVYYKCTINVLYYVKVFKLFDQNVKNNCFFCARKHK